MADKWNISFIRGKTYQQTITMSGVSDIATATGWTLKFAFPNAAPCLTATTANGLLVAGSTSAQKILVVPVATTLGIDAGNGEFIFSIEWTGGVSRPYYRGRFTSTPDVGEVQS